MDFLTLAQVRYLGQGRVLRELSVIANAIKQGENVNILIQAPSGHGKTILAHLFLEYLDKERNNSFKYLPNKTGDITIRREVRFHFVDEVHRLSSPESIYPLLDSEEFSFIFTTNEYDKLKEPLINRCIVLLLEKYSIEVLAWIVKTVLEKRGINLEHSWYTELAHYCRGNPRIAKATATRLAFAFQQLTLPETLEELHQFMLQLLGATKDGLTPQDRNYLEALQMCKGTASLKTLVGITNIPGKAIEDNIEPFLISKGLITITSRGRQLNG